MKAGVVVRIRVNPQDCQSVLDLLQRIGIEHRTLSFSQCVSTAFASLLETARVNRMLPEPDPFQYLNRMNLHIGQGRGLQGKRKAAADTIGSIGEKFSAPAVPQPRFSEAGKVLPQTYSPEQEVPLSIEERMARSRLSELVAKKEMVEDGAPGVVWQTSDQEEWDRLYPIVYPEG